MLYKNRHEAGKQHALRLFAYRDAHPLILALPRGGVIVGQEVARALGAPLEVIITRKLYSPKHPELSLGALGEGGVRIIDSLGSRLLEITPQEQTAMETEAKAQMDKYLKTFRAEKPLPEIKGHTVILVDDGLATGLTARAAIEVIRKHKPKQIILAVPVSGVESSAAILKYADSFVSGAVPPSFLFASEWYENFDPCSDEEILQALQTPNHGSSAAIPPFRFETKNIPPNQIEIKMETPQGNLEATLELPKNPHGIVLFAHGGGSDRNSPRTLTVSEKLLKDGLATLRMDLLSAKERETEKETFHLRFNIGLLAERIESLTQWILSSPAAKNLPVGYFGSSTGAAAMLLAAAKGPHFISAVVSRGGRPDLVEPLLPKLKTPTLLITGENDSIVTAHNRQAFDHIKSKKKEMKIISGAGHLFEESGKIEEVAQLTAKWFKKYS